MAVKRTDNTDGALLNASEDNGKSKKTTKGNGSVRSSAWAAVVYPAGENEQEWLASYDKFISRIKAAGGDNIAFIYHDKDKDEAGNIKKAHIHVLKRFDKGVTAGFALEWLNRSVGDCITTTCKGAFKDRSADMRDAYNYLAHPNSPLGGYDDGGKYGYDPSNVVTIGQFVPTGFADFMMLVMSSDGFLDLCDKCRGSEDMAKMLIKHSYFAKTYYTTAKNGD